VQVLQRLCDSFRRKRRDKWQEEWFLHHDNAPSHTSIVVQQFLAEKSIVVITQPPYCPDLAPSDFWMFPTLKVGLKGTHFVTMEDIKSNATANSGRLQKKPSASASNNGRVDGASVYVCVCVYVFVCVYVCVCARAQGSYLKVIR
jgi:hypothetical protein